MTSRHEADYLLEEWARWARGEAVDVGYPHATPFGSMIVPDPAASSLPVDVDRAQRTERCILKLPQRYRYLVKLHYLDTAPIDAKARRLRMRRERYKLLIRGVQTVVALAIDRTDGQAYKQHSAGAP